MTGPAVSVVIPTVGRASVAAAVRSALAQTHEILEVIVVVDADVEPAVPKDDRVTVIRTPGRVGSSRSRQLGIDASSGDVVGLLDDDDEWLPNKVAVQLASVPTGAELWIASCRYRAVSDGGSTEWPVRLIGARQPVGEYLFRFHSLRFGGASAQTSTLLFPRRIAEQVPMTLPFGSVHDDPAWLIEVRRQFPDVPIFQSGEVLVKYNMTSNSLSRSARDESAAYIRWGMDYLADSDGRTRADYFLTSPLTSAVAGRSLRGVVRSWRAGLAGGRPSKWALGYAVLSTGRVLANKLAIVATRQRKR